MTDEHASNMLVMGKISDTTCIGNPSAVTFITLQFIKCGSLANGFQTERENAFS